MKEFIEAVRNVGDGTCGKKTSRQEVYQGRGKKATHAAGRKAWKEWVVKNAGSWQLNNTMDRVMKEHECDLPALMRMSDTREVCKLCSVRKRMLTLDVEQLPPPNEFNILRKVEDPLLDALFGDHFYDDRRDMHSVQARDFVGVLITDMLWPCYRRAAARTIQRIAKLEQHAEEQWQGECSFT